MPALLPSEGPIRARARQHWIVLLRRPHRWAFYAALILFAVALLSRNGTAWIVLLLFLAVSAWLRVREWRAERFLLTGKRMIHVSGTVETTTSEASLRVDRISGIRLIETPLGKVMHYANLEVEAPGDHPGLSRLIRLSNPSRFYDELRYLVYGEPGRPDPDDGPTEYVTAPLPQLDSGAPQDTGRHRRGH